ncbi:MAG: amino acid ABC transporter permease [Actinomycetota bacterium]
MAHTSRLRWIRTNLFSTWYNSSLTIAFALLLGFVAYRGLQFVFVTGRWEIIRRNLTLLLIGLFPRDESWRVWAALFLVTAGVAIATGALRRRALVDPDAAQHPGSPVRRLIDALRRIAPVILLVVTLLSLRPDPVAAVLVAAIAGAALVSWRVGCTVPPRLARMVAAAGVALVLSALVLLTAFGGVGWDRWGGLLLTMFLAVAGILLSFPIGVLLAVGRRSNLPVVRVVSTGYIELIRGVPLITLLFMAFFVIGFLVPPGTGRPSGVTRALIAFVMFTSAYVAEIVRGGLQSVPREQTEAALAVGLRPIMTLRLIVLPQALRSVIPALVGQFISLFKDTSLVVAIGLTELLRVAQVLTSQGDFRGQQLQAETLVFASFIYWVGSYTMSRESQRLEGRLGIGTR